MVAAGMAGFRDARNGYSVCAVHICTQPTLQIMHVGVSCIHPEEASSYPLHKGVCTPGSSLGEI